MTTDTDGVPKFQPPGEDESDNPSSILATIVPYAAADCLRAFHYTDSAHLKEIARGRTIMPPPHDKAFEFDAPPVVWTSLNPVFEPVCQAGMQFLQDCSNYLYAFVEPDFEIDAARIEVDTEGLWEWSGFLAAEGVDPISILSLAMGDQRLGSDPNDWAVSDMPVGIDRWLSVEVWDGSAWIPVAESNDPRHITISRMLPTSLSSRTKHSGAGNEIIGLIHAQGGFDRVQFAEAEFDFYHTLEDDLYETPFELLREKNSIYPVFNVVHAVSTLNSAQADEIVRMHGPEAWEDMQKNQKLKNFVTMRLGLQ